MEVDNEGDKLDQLPADAVMMSENILKDILQKYKTVIDGISDDHFQAFNDIMKSEAHKTMSVGGGEPFRKKLFESLSNKFKNMWMEMSMDICVSTLEKSKADPLVNNKYWRPANLSAEELMRPYLVKILARKRRILLDQILSQEQQIAELVSQVEGARKIFNAQKDKRTRLLAQIEADCIKIDETHARIDSITTPN